MLLRDVSNAVIIAAIVLLSMLLDFALVASAFRHRPALESLLFAVALAVGLTPEFLPMITTATLAQGALRKARRKVIVKHLAAIDAAILRAGGVDVAGYRTLDETPLRRRRPCRAARPCRQVLRSEGRGRWPLRCLGSGVLRWGATRCTTRGSNRTPWPGT